MNARKVKRLGTLDGVIAHLGGPARVARLTKRGVTAVSNWKRRDRAFPPELYFVITDACGRGVLVARHLFAFERGKRRAR